MFYIIAVFVYVNVAVVLWCFHCHFQFCPCYRYSLLSHQLVGIVEVTSQQFTLADGNCWSGAFHVLNVLSVAQQMLLNDQSICLHCIIQAKLK